jgi:hypothetical protein
VAKPQADPHQLDLWERVTALECEVADLRLNKADLGDLKSLEARVDGKLDQILAAIRDLNTVKV